MVFIGIVLIAIFLYIRDYKIPALLLFFFFITSGFNLIPEEITEFAFISKGSDYAFMILVGIVVIDSIYIRGYFNRDNFTKYLIVFASFLIICIIYNKFVLKLGWSDILRTCRYQFFWIVYFLFRHLPKEKLQTLLKCLFFTSLFTAILFLLQIFIDEHILIEGAKLSVKLFGIKIPRFYNQPDMLFFFTFMALYNNPLKGFPKYLSMFIFTAAILGAFHRSLIGGFFISVFIGYVIRLPRLKRIYILTTCSILIGIATIFIGYKFINSRTFIDLKTVLSGEISMDMEIDMDDLQNSTFTFRMLHLFERNQYIMENPKAMFLGAGLMPEDSKIVEKMFDFKTGLSEGLTDRVIQLDTSDISHSVLLLRFGYLGTVLYLLLFVYLTVFFYKKRSNDYGFFSFLFLTLAFSNSFFSGILINPVTFILPLISYNIIKKMDFEKVNTLN